MDRRSKERIVPLEVYTDGSLKRMGQNMTFGGWSFVIVRDNEKIYEQAGYEFDTTSQRMELTAIKEGLRQAQSFRKSSERVIIYSDSAYAINCYQKEWYINWMHNGWMNANNQPVANKDLWFDIIPYFDNFWYTFNKVRGHSGVLWNEECDKMAQAAAEKIRTNFEGSKRMKNDSIYEVTREDYKSFIEQIKQECRRVETVKINDKFTAVKVFSNRTGKHLASRIYDSRESVTNREPERYYIFELPNPNETIPPIPKVKVVLETKEQVQALIDGLKRMRENNND